MTVKKEEDGGGNDEPKPIVDSFGNERTPDGKIVPPPEVAADEEKDKDGKKKEDAAPAEDIEKSPVVVELRRQLKDLETDKSSMGGNLSAQGKAIDKLKQELADIKSGKSTGAERLFKDIKRVKDLPKDRQDEMTDSEKQLFDTLADTQERMNTMVADAAKKADDAVTAAGVEEEAEATAEEFNGRVQGGVLALIGVGEGETPTSVQKALANSIIEEFNQFSGNDKLTPKQLKERIEKAAKLVPDYKPAKEQQAPRGGAAKPVDSSTMSEIDKIVADTKKGKTSGTFSL